MLPKKMPQKMLTLLSSKKNFKPLTTKHMLVQKKEQTQVNQGKFANSLSFFKE